MLTSFRLGPGFAVGLAPVTTPLSESFVATLKAELVSRCRFPSREVARVAIFEYLECLYNRTRIHSSLGYKSLVDFEEDRCESLRHSVRETCLS